VVEKNSILEKFSTDQFNIDYLFEKIKKLHFHVKEYSFRTTVDCKKKFYSFGPIGASHFQQQLKLDQSMKPPLEPEPEPEPDIFNIVRKWVDETDITSVNNFDVRYIIMVA
jgi:hypothetical protein